MSFHTITMMVRWAVEADEKISVLLDDLSKLPIEIRKKDQRVETIVKDMYTKWCKGTRIERLAIIGWQEFESICIFCQMLDNLPELRQQYQSEVLKHGKPMLQDNDLEKYEYESNRIRKEI